MMAPVMSEEFCQALRTELVSRAEVTQAQARVRRWRWITGGTLGVLLAGGATFAAADLFNQPGAPVTRRWPRSSQSPEPGPRRSISGRLPGRRVWVDISCLSAGTVELGAGGAALTCTDADAGTEHPASFSVGCGFQPDDGEWKGPYPRVALELRVRGIFRNDTGELHDFTLTIQTVRGRNRNGSRRPHPVGLRTCVGGTGYGRLPFPRTRRSLACCGRRLFALSGRPNRGSPCRASRSPRRIPRLRGRNRSPGRTRKPPVPPHVTCLASHTQRYCGRYPPAEAGRGCESTGPTWRSSESVSRHTSAWVGATTGADPPGSIKVTPAVATGNWHGVSRLTVCEILAQMYACPPGGTVTATPARPYSSAVGELS